MGKAALALLDQGAQLAVHKEKELTKKNLHALQAKKGASAQQP